MRLQKGYAPIVKHNKGIFTVTKVDDEGSTNT
jgi:hypothetical protein